MPMSDREFNRKVASDRAHLGSLAEVLVAADCYRRNYDVFIPLVHVPKGYDIIVDRPSGLVKIQVKMASRNMQVDIGWLWYKENYVDGKIVIVERVKYVPGDFDYLAGVDRDTSEVFYIPADDFDYTKAKFTIKKELKEKYLKF